MKNLALTTLVLFAVACNSGTGNNEHNDTTLANPPSVQPPADAIPDSMKIVNDSAIVPEHQPDSGHTIRPGQRPVEQ
ncbi:MAG: hypothetical protein EOP50_16345 [Sphingobacteriales bacterium]|nr:MAG: hypothetical protein EOP50_16345 [Sphingobacteriales bacterium]